MLHKNVLFCFAVTLALIFGIAPTQDLQAEPKTSVIGAPHPSAKDKNSPNIPLQIEQDTESLIFNERHQLTGKMKTTKNVNSNKIRAEAAPKVVTVIAIADEEFRKAYPENWKKRISDAIEKMDNAFQKKHNLDFQVKAYGEWHSDGENDEKLLADLDKEWNQGEYHFVVGFTKDKNFIMGGIAYVYSQKPDKSAVSLSDDMEDQHLPYILQHELSHNFGLNHDEQGSGIRCTMNYDTMYETTDWHPEHNDQVAENKSWYTSQ